MVISDQRRDLLARRIRLLVAATITYNVIEATIALTEGTRASMLCTYLSAVLLGGLVLNGVLGWSWADPVAALGIAALAVREGINAWRGDPCCAQTPEERG